MNILTPTGAKAYAKGTPEERAELNTLLLALTRRRNEARTSGELPTELGKNIGDMLPLAEQEKRDIIEKKQELLRHRQELLRRHFLQNEDGSLNRVPVGDMFVDMSGDTIRLSNAQTGRRFTNDDLELFFAMLIFSPVKHLYLNGNLIHDVTPLMNTLPQTVKVLMLNNNIIDNTELLHPENRPAPDHLFILYYRNQHL